MNIRYLFCGAAAMAASAALATGCRAQEAQVRVEHAAARLLVIPEARNNVSVTVHHGTSRLPELTVRQEGDHVVVDGGLAMGVFGARIDRARCVGSYTTTHLGPLNRVVDHRAVIVPGVGRVEYADLPVITARVPLNARIGGSSAVYGDIGHADTLHLSAAGCGDWTVADVRGPVEIDMAGSGDVRAGAMGALKGRLSGSGDLQTGQVGGDADLSLAGSGDVATGAVSGGLLAHLAASGDIAVASVAGPVQASMAGSGDIRIHAGHAPTVKVSIAGSGDFGFNGDAGALSGSVVGSGDVYVAHVSGPVSKSVIGSGEVRAGR